ncbi:xyloglucan endotransglycosylase/hydrolase precursor XTH-27 [Populus alba x Populus x berolinensis]|nr:xyloglucan endotransglycosylase/hydrolase precursor XTH-27 [Populus alba x Populus x berolinensis]
MHCMKFFESVLKEELHIIDLLVGRKASRMELEYPQKGQFRIKISFLHAKRHRSTVGGLEVIISERARDKSRKVQSSKREKTRDKSRICEGGPDILGPLLLHSPHPTSSPSGVLYTLRDMAASLWTLFLGMLFMVSGTMGAAPRKPVDVPFGRNYAPTWAFDHIKYFNGGSEIQLQLDKYTGTGFQSKGSYLFGHFSMQMKLVPGDSAGTVTAFYLSSQNSEHDEIDFEFLGNRTGQPYILQTNVFTGGKGDREQRIYLWFDPTTRYHSYSVLWNSYLVVFFVDDVPIRVFKNCKDLGVKFPFNQPMKIYSSLWNADDWATRGGLEKTDWSKAPFIASYKSFHIDGCEASVEAKFCATQGTRWWDQKEFQDLDALQYRRLRWIKIRFNATGMQERQRHMKMPAGHGVRSRTRDLFARPFRKKGYIPLSTYLRTYKVGDYVDIKVNGAVHKGMPHKFYHGRTGRVWNVTKRAIGVVGNRIIGKKIHVRVEHVQPSRCREEFKLRKKKNDELKAEAKACGEKISTKRQPQGPKPGFMLEGATIETVTPIPYDVVNDLKGDWLS